MLPVKLSFRGQLRRATLRTLDPQQKLSYQTLVNAAYQLFPAVREKPLTFLWSDDENDLVCCSSDEEVEEAMRVMEAEGKQSYRFDLSVEDSSHSAESAGVGQSAERAGASRHTDAAGGRAVHRSVTCDGCGVHPIVGVRYKCTVRDDFDLCEQCEKSSVQPFAMIKIYEEEQAPAAIFVVLRDDANGGEETFRHCRRGGRGRCGRHGHGHGGPHGHGYQDGEHGPHHSRHGWRGRCGGRSEGCGGPQQEPQCKREGRRCWRDTLNRLSQDLDPAPLAAAADAAIKAFVESTGEFASNGQHDLRRAWRDSVHEILKAVATSKSYLETVHADAAAAAAADEAAKKAGSAPSAAPAAAPTASTSLREQLDVEDAVLQQVLRMSLEEANTASTAASGAGGAEPAVASCSAAPAPIPASVPTPVVGVKVEGPVSESVATVEATLKSDPALPVANARIAAPAPVEFQAARIVPSSLSMKYVSDVTVPDGFEIDANTDFIKVWRVLNNGSVAWPAETVLAFCGGDDLVNGKFEYPVGAIAVGQEIDLAINLHSPSFPGRCVSYFRLRAGTLVFGQRLWADIRVVKRAESAPASEPAAAVQPSQAEPAASAAATTSVPESATTLSGNWVLIGDNVEDEEEDDWPAVLSAVAKIDSAAAAAPVVAPITQAPASAAVAPSAPPAPLTAVSPYAPQLQQLQEMGFDDVERFLPLIQKHVLLSHDEATKARGMQHVLAALLG